MSAPDVIDGTAVDLETAELQAAVAAPLPVVQPVGPLAPEAIDAVVAGLDAYRQLCAVVLDPREDFEEAGGKRFATASAWTKLRRAFRISIEVLDRTVERDEDGRPFAAGALVRATHPSGEHADGDGYCSLSEERFSKEKARKRLEHDLRSTATTRARNRAVSELIGMGDEEVAASRASGGAGIPAWALPCTAEQDQAVRRAFGLLAGDPTGERARETYEAMRAMTGGGLTPTVVAAVVTDLADAATQGGEA
jgi:hypothetical protein